MKKMKLKANNGAYMTDVVIAVIILSLFVGVIGQLYYKIALNNEKIRLNAIAVYHAVQIAEYIDKISYEEVTEELNNNLKEKYNYPDIYNITITVENYNTIDSSKEDIIKIVTIEAKYEVLKNEQSYKIRKLKIKEI